MDIIWAIRELCKGDKGFENMFDKSKSGGKLAILTGGDRDAELFEALLYGGARETLVEMINDAYNFKGYAVKAHGFLVKDGLSAYDAKRALEIFFIAFGFPGYRTIEASETVTDEQPSYKTVYEGEVKNGKPHGVGVRNFYYEGKWTNLDECVWIDGVMCGYDYAKELEFGAFEDQKIGFVVNDNFVGNIRIIPAGDSEPFDDTVKKFSVKSVK